MSFKARRSLIRGLSLLATSAVIGSACTEPTPPPRPASIDLSLGAIALASLGDSSKIVATVRDENGAVLPDRPEWRSNDNAIASVSADGIIVSVANGATTVEAKIGDISKLVNVTVQQVPVSVTVVPANVTLVSLGQTATVTASAADARGRPTSQITATLVSSAPSIATVGNDGVVTALANGTSTITATAGSASAVATVTVAQAPAKITLSPATIDLESPGPGATATAVVKDARDNPIADASIAWSVSDPAVARVVAGLVSPVGSGTTSLTAVHGTLQATAPVVVRQSNTAVVESIDPFLATPMSGHESEIRVLVVRYLPTKDGLTLDQRLSSFPYPAADPAVPIRPATLADVRKRIDVFDRRVKFMLEEGSRFRGYANPAALPALGYRIVNYVTIYEPMPLSARVAGPCVPGQCVGNRYFADHAAVMERVNGRDWVENQGVREVWVWGYEGSLEQPESNMSSPLTGDISNSHRFPDDLPIYNKTYTLYAYNFARAQSEAVHNHGHQLEAILGYVDQRQHGNTNLFWRDFVGRQGALFQAGRAGWTHMPPNTTADYDYTNLTQVPSDIEDWRPDNTGAKTTISAARWRDLVYPWPAGDVPLRDGRLESFAQGTALRTESQWYIYWMQSMPGRGNSIPAANGEKMTNWWAFTADWDKAISSQLGLVTTAASLPITIRNDYVGQIFLEPGGDLPPGQTRTVNASGPFTVRVYECYEPGGCRMDSYVLTPGKNYKVISDPTGPPANLTIVER